jgi:hypothetical protein
MNAIPDCLFFGYEPLDAGLKLGDPNDRHLLATLSRLVEHSLQIFS